MVVELMPEVAVQAVSARGLRCLLQQTPNTPLLLAQVELAGLEVRAPLIQTAQKEMTLYLAQ